MSEEVPLIIAHNSRVTLIHASEDSCLHVVHPQGTVEIPLSPSQAETMRQASPTNEDGPLEIERKFLVEQPPPLDLMSYKHKHISQGYVVATPEASLRIRSQGPDKHQLNIKTGQGLKRVEVDITISTPSADKLWSLVGHQRITKTRYLIPGAHPEPMELDVYHGKLDGLIVLEQEFATIEEAQAFIPPSWVSKDVTDDPSYTNAELARRA